MFEDNFKLKMTEMIVKRVLELSEELESNDYFGHYKKNPDDKIREISDRLWK